MAYRVLCVCLGNICRSPTAEVILRHYATEAGLSIEVDSAGTSNYHPNKAPDTRSQQHGKARGYDLSALRARQITAQDFESFDLILAMDHNNLADLQDYYNRLVPQGNTALKARLALMSQHDTQFPQQAVPDPYYGEARDFERVIDQCESSALAWVAHWVRTLDRQQV